MPVEKNKCAVQSICIMLAGGKRITQRRWVDEHGRLVMRTVRCYLLVHLLLLHCRRHTQDPQ